MPASPDPDLALRLAKAIVEIYAGAALRLLELVAQRLASGIDQPGWATDKLLEAAQLRDQAAGVVDRLATEGPPAVLQAITEAWEAGESLADEDLEALRRAAVEAATAEIASVPRDRGLKQLVAETVSQVQSTHLQIVRRADDIYRDVINEVSSPGVVIGEATRRQAAQRALDRFAERGITGFVDRAGRRWELAAYVEMAVRTGSGRAQVAGALQRFSEAGRDLVIVSDAPEECAVCRPWEGEVLSITGTDGDHESVATAVAAGLFHANCRHAVGAFIPGLTRRFERTEDPHGDTIRQEQRMLERNKRAALRRAAVAFDEKDRREAKAQAAVYDGQLALIVEDRHAYAAERAKFLRGLEKFGHPRAGGWAEKWERTAAGIAPGTRGKRLRYREQVLKAH